MKLLGRDRKDEKFQEMKRMERDMVQRIMAKRAEIIEEFAKAYIAETGLAPSECELVEVQPKIVSGEAQARFFFRKRAESFQIGVQAYKDILNLITSQSLTREALEQELKTRIRTMENMANAEKK